MPRPYRFWLCGVLSSLVGIHSAAAAAREWVVARSPGFVVLSDAGEKRAREVAHQFEQVRGLFRQVLQARVDPGRMVLIIAVKDEDGLRELLPGYWERKGGMRPAGVFHAGRDKHLVALRLDAQPDNTYPVLYHEYTHLLIRLNVRWIPLWLNEGLAEFWGSSDIDEKEVRWGIIPAPHVLYLRRAALPRLDELLVADQTSPLYTESKSVAGFYAASAVLTHYLLLGAQQRSGQIQEFFKLLGSDMDEPEALRRAFGDLRKLESELKRYVQLPTFASMKGAVRIDPQEVAVAPVSRAQADALRGDYLARTGRPREASVLLESALQQDPGLSLAHEGQGVVDSNRGHRRAALRHFTEAARLAPGNYVAQFRAGLIQDDGAEPGADRARREQALRHAVEVNPAFAPAWAALSRLLSEREDRRAEAVAAAERACALEPAAAAHRVALWQALGRAGRAAEAARVEESLALMARRDNAVLDEVTAALDETGRSTDIEPLLRKAHAANPRSAMPIIMLADFLDRHEKQEEAERLLREALQADPQSIALMGSLAYALSDSPAKAAEGLAMIERVLAKAPGVPAFLDTKGWALFRLKRLPEAESVLRSAVEGSGDPVILDHLGDVLTEQGRAAEARVQYEQALGTPGVKAELRTSLQAKLERGRPPASPPPP